jgi:hypothetical protein
VRPSGAAAGAGAGTGAGGQEAEVSWYCLRISSDFKRVELRPAATSPLAAAALSAALSAAGAVTSVAPSVREREGGGGSGSANGVVSFPISSLVRIDTPER